MQYASITAFLSGALSPEALAVEIEAEVAAFSASLRLTSQAAVRISSGPEFPITRDGARRLLKAILDERLPFDAANYVADCISLSHDFYCVDDATREAVFFIEDDTGRYVSSDDAWRPTREEILTALARLD